MITILYIVSHAGAVAYSRAHFGQGSGPILLNNIQCVGTERFLLECYWTAHNAHTCLHSEDAGVMCQGIAIIKHYTTLGNTNSYSYNYCCRPMHSRISSNVRY